ncbi:hypothetical protein PV11_04800 [Exophiala sideris]|uniref:Apple domain-containing protein n=1 Tax=Exophiala sideris TaxID=1016849 RepID=A0A0D1X4X0_9EURO|nr:hypothetical protein PV11_04800 [Exophiala sideris]
MASGGYISTTGAASTQKFAVNSTLGSISTFFSIVSNNTVGRRDDSPGSGILQWQNDNFVGKQAVFSTFGSIVQVSFDGEAPAGSEVVTLAAIPAGDIASSSGISVSTGSTSMPESAPNSPTTTPNALSSGPSLLTTPSVGISGTASSLPMGSTPIYRSSTSARISSTVLAYPTSTGPPSCNDRSPYDGTVNDNYLILCDTDLPGYDITSVPASDIADCIGACNAYVAPSEGICVAVTFNSSTATDPCTLKAQVGAVDRGADAFVQAAIVVNEPYAPTIVFTSSGSSSPTSTVSSATTALSTSTPSLSALVGTSSSVVPTTTSTSLTTSSPVNTVSSSQQQSNAPTTTPQTSTTRAMTMSTSTSLTTTPLTTAQSSTSLSTSRASSSPSSTLLSSSVTTTPSTTQTTSRITTSSLTSSQMGQTTTSTVLTSTTRSTTATTTTTTTASYCSATPTTTNLCPTYNHQALNVNGDGSCYEVECSTALQGNQLTGNSTTKTSLKTCTAVCNLYNEAIPYGCVGVSYYNSVTGNNPNCILFSTITGTASTSGVDSGRLMYQGYPSISDPSYGVITTTATSTSSEVVTSGTTTKTASTTASGCPPAPTAGSCPGNSPYCYAYTNYGNTDNFEVECDTVFTGAALQAIIAFSFEDCASWCQYANEQGIDVPGSVCVGFTFQEIPVYTQGGPNNCFRYSSLTCASRNNATFDSGRLLFSGYPAMTDYSGSAFSC